MTTRAALAERLIPFSSLRSSTEAFIDYALPECTPKFNYALIGSGVAQNPNQPVSLREPHGFQVGGVSLPHGKVNPPHMHFTCEVFVCTRGSWRMQWGFAPEALHADIGEGDLISIPTWIYRGFTNIGVDDGFMFTALGGDPTGGILWGPGTIAAAAQQGVFLTAAGRIVDTRRGERLEPGTPLYEPMSAAEIAALRRYTPGQMAERTVRFAQLHWGAHSLLDAALPDCGAQLAPALGLGMSEDRDAHAPLTNAHGVTIEWLRIPPGGRVSRHRLREKQVLIAKTGEIDIELEASDGPAHFRLQGHASAWDTYALPADLWRTLRNPGGTEALAVLMSAGDQRKRIEWDAAVQSAAAAAGWVRDANGYVAPRRFVERAQ